MIDFGPFKLGLPVLSGESGYEYFGTENGRPIAIWRYPAVENDVRASLQDTVALASRFPEGRWQRLFRTGVEDGAPWLTGELVQGVSLGRVIYARQFEDDPRSGQDNPLPEALAVGIGLSFARALLERARATMSEREFRVSTIWTGQWATRVDWSGRLRPALDPLAFADQRPIAGPSDFHELTPESVQPGQLSWRAQSDVFQAAALIGFLLRGDGLFGDDPQEVIERVRAPEPQPLELLCPAASAPLRAVLQAALARDPARRTATVAELIEQLASFGSEAEAERWLAEHLAAHHAEQRVHQQRAFAELGGTALEPLPPELEQRVLERRNDESAWLILGDWLMAQQLPRGELVIRHHRERRHEAVLYEDLSAAEREALSKIDPFDGPHVLRMFYRYGYVDAVSHHEEITASIGRRRVLGVDVNPDFRLSRLPDPVERDLLHALNLPTMRFLRVVLIDSDCGELDAVVRALAAASHRGVEEVFVPPNRFADVEARLRPKLRRLKHVRACGTDRADNIRLLFGQG